MIRRCDTPLCLTTTTSKSLHPNPKFQNLLKQFPDLFPEKDDVGIIHSYTHHIPTRTDRPVRQSAYIKTPEQANYIRVNKTIQLFLCITSCPRHRKGKAELRFVIDYRRLNAITVPDEFPLPHWLHFSSTTRQNILQ